jgi:hypothetical protein
MAASLPTSPDFSGSSRHPLAILAMSQLTQNAGETSATDSASSAISEYRPAWETLARCSKPQFCLARFFWPTTASCRLFAYAAAKSVAGRRRETSPSLLILSAIFVIKYSFF